MPMSLESELRRACSSSVFFWTDLRRSSSSLKASTGKSKLRVFRRATTSGRFFLSIVTSSMFLYVLKGKNSPQHASAGSEHKVRRHRAPLRAEIIIVAVSELYCKSTLSATASFTGFPCRLIEFGQAPELFCDPRFRPAVRRVIPATAL